MSNPFREIIQAKEEYEAKVKQFGKDKFSEMVKEFFEKHQDVVSFRWNQYTPSFNDGDPCYFTVGQPDLMVTKEFAVAHPDLEIDLDDEDEDLHWLEDGWSYGLEKKDKAAYDVLSAAAEDIGSFLEVEDVLETVFGDGVTVTVDKDSIEVEDYDCGY